MVMEVTQLSRSRTVATEAFVFGSRSVGTLGAGLRTFVAWVVAVTLDTIISIQRERSLMLFTFALCWRQRSQA